MALVLNENIAVFGMVRHGLGQNRTGMVFGSRKNSYLCAAKI